MVGGLAAAPALAAPVATLDADAFSYRWDFDGSTTAENFDRYNTTTGAAAGDGTNEWGSTPTPSSGVVSIANAAFSNTFWTSADAAIAQLTTATGYTVEYRVKMQPNVTTGNNGGLSVDAGDGVNLAAATVQYVDLDTSKDLAIYWDLGAIGAVYATVADNEFFTIRIVATPDAGADGGVSYTFYVNGAQVGDGLGRERAFASRRMLIGDVGGGTRGTTEVDYVAFTPGAYAPVPEPGSLALAGLGSLFVLARRRS